MRDLILAGTVGCLIGIGGTLLLSRPGPESGRVDALHQIAAAPLPPPPAAPSSPHEAKRRLGAVAIKTEVVAKNTVLAEDMLMLPLEEAGKVEYNAILVPELEKRLAASQEEAALLRNDVYKVKQHRNIAVGVGFGLGLLMGLLL